MSRRTIAGCTGLLLACAAGLAGCSGFPTPPGGLPDGWVPSVAPSEIPSAEAGSPLGFTAAQSVAVRVRSDNCEFYVTGSGFVLDEHTIVTNRELVDGYVNIEASLADGTDLTVTGATRGISGEYEFLTVRESLAPHATLAESDPGLHDLLEMVGYPSFEAIRSTSGSSSGATWLHGDTSNVAYITTIAEPGWGTGAPVFNKDGEVAGMYYAGDKDEALSAYVPVSALHALLDDSSLVEDHAPTTCE